MRCATLRLFAGSALLLISSWSWSEETATVFVDSMALNANVIDYVARTGKPEEISVSKGQTIASVIATHCGRIDDDYVALLRNGTYPGVPREFDLNTPFSMSGSITLPACLRVRPSFEFGIAEKLNALTLDRKVCSSANSTNIDRAACREPFSAPNFGAGDIVWEDSSFGAEHMVWEDSSLLANGFYRFADWSHEFAPSGWSSIVVRPELKASPKEVADELRLQLIAAGQNPKIAKVDDPGEIELYSSLTDSELSVLQACQLRPGEVTGQTAFDVAQLVEVLSYNLRKLAADQKVPDRVVIMIPDTGLQSNGNPPFPRHRVRVRETWPPSEDDLRPFNGYEKHQHGTYVATLALGGPSFMQILESLGLPIEVAPVNVFSERVESCVVDGQLTTCLRYQVRPDGFNDAIDQASRWNAIVNLSVGRQARFRAIEQQLSKDSKVLFVVAAGNDGEELSQRMIYPARYGSENDGTDNLITVASLDLNGRRASFSNHGESYVDIAAPGCVQPVLDYSAESGGFRVAAASGTSFSAPSVSFVAALLKATWLDASPREIKRRLLISSDISLDLKKDGIKDGRRLNAMKALAVYQDIVEAKVDGRTVLIRGRIDEGAQLFDFCEGALSLYRFPGANRAVVKKVASIASPAASFIIYWQNSEGVLNSATCAKGTFSLKIRDDFTNWVYTLGPDNIIDVVFSERTN